MQAVGRESLDGSHALASRLRNRSGARAHGGAVNVNRASPAQSRAAAELRSRHVQGVAQNPEQRRLGRDTHLPLVAVHLQRQICHDGPKVLIGKAEHCTENLRKEKLGFTADCVTQCENLVSIEKTDIFNPDDGPTGVLDAMKMRDVIRAIGDVLESDCEPE